MMKKFTQAVAVVLALTMMLLCLSACAEGGKEDVSDNGVTIVDMAGNSVVLAQEPASVFCQSSMFEQMILALGAESLLRASSYARTDDARNIWTQTLYPQILDVEPAGGDQKGITNELLVSYELDLMFVGNQDQYNEFTALGIPCVVLDIQSLDDLRKGIEIMGQCLGGSYQAKAESITAYCGKLLADVKEKTAQLSEAEKITAYFMESRYAATEPTLYMTWGPESFQANCLHAAGVSTVADTLFDGGVRAELTVEQLLLSDPDVIMIGGFYEKTNYDALLKEEHLKTLSAVQNGRIYRVPVGMTEWTRIGVESFLLPLWYGAVLYPDLYTEIDLNAAVKAFYKDVMGVELTEDYQAQILSGAEGPGR